MTHSDFPERPFLTIKEASAYLRLHAMTVYRLAKSGKIPSFRVGSGWRFSRESLDGMMGGKSKIGSGSFSDSSIIISVFWYYL